MVVKEESEHESWASNGAPESSTKRKRHSERNVKEVLDLISRWR